jgi:hypothetical protein
MNEKFDKQKMLDFMRAEYEFVERTLALLSPEQMLEPDVQGPWSVKDTLAHLTRWHVRALDWLAAARQGEQPELPEPGYTWEQIDDINDRTYREDKDLPLDTVLEAFRQTYRQLYAETEQLSEEELFGRAGLSLYFRDPLFGYIAHNSFFHYREHIEPVRRWMSGIWQTREHQTVQARKE